MSSSSSCNSGNTQRKRILLVSPHRPRGGNERTASRIAEILSARYDLVRAKSSEADTERMLKRFNPDLMVCIHAVRSGHFLDSKFRPRTILVVGGTDVNVYAKKDKKVEADVKRRCGDSDALVSFTNTLEELSTFGAKRYAIIPQGVRLSKPNAEEMCRVQELYADLSENGTKRVLLLLAGLRPVKDVLYLVDYAEKTFSTTMKGFVLAICGPVLDKDYADRVRRRTKDMTCVRVISRDGLSHPMACGLLSKCDALVNSSLSEGSSVAIAEAYAMGKLVLARNIPANRATLINGTEMFLSKKKEEGDSINFERIGCGVLYKSPEGFINAVKEYFVNKGSTKKREWIVRNGPRVVKAINETERLYWDELVYTVLASPYIRSGMNHTVN